MVNYQELNQSLRALIQGVPHRTANLANASALLYMTLDRINWAGFYLLEGDRLILGPLQGKPACIEIPIGKGVCGTAAERREAILVPDVHAFPGHIACDSASNSEIVLPLFQRKRAEDGTEALSVVGVLDIDSPLKNRFTEEDRVGLTEFAEILSDALFS
jgi:GAF domain-containing protein